MSEKAVEWYRWALVWIYAVITAAMDADGITAGEFVCSVLLGAVFLIAIVTMGWVAAAAREHRE